MQQIVGVKFSTYGKLSTKTYCYKTDIPDLKVGDWCVAMVKGDPSTVCVVEKEVLNPEARSRATAWLVCKIDLLPYLEREKNEIMNRRSTDA
jgi:hypothetical protein